METMFLYGFMTLSMDSSMEFVWKCYDFVGKCL